jgi:hypothetical protein
MYLRDLCVDADEAIVDRHPGGFVSRFHRESCCVTELYLCLIWRKVATPDTSKVQFVFSDLIGHPAEPEKTACGVMVQPWPFPFTDYKSSDKEAKKRLVADEFHKGLLWIARHRGWDERPFEEVYRQCLDRNLMLEAFWRKKTWLSRDKRVRVKVYYRFDLDAVELYAVVFDRRGRELGRKLLGTGIPGVDCLRSFIGTGRWRSKSRFELCAKHTFLKEVWSADLSKILREHGKLP